MKVKLASKHEIQRINSKKFELGVNAAVSTGLKRIANLQKITLADVAGRISGSVGSTWFMRHFQPGFSGNRHQRIIAAISWMTQTPLAAIYCGESTEDYSKMVSWGVNRQGFEVMLRVCDSDPEDFENFINDGLRWGIFQKGITQSMAALDKYDAASFMFPKRLNLDLFGYDYYRSIGKVLREIRIANQLMIESIAWMLGVSPEVYLRMESPKINDSFNQVAGIKSVLAFNLEKSSVFLNHMENYRGLLIAREVQEIRTAIFSQYIDLDDMGFKELIKYLIQRRKCVKRFRKQSRLIT